MTDQPIQPLINPITHQTMPRSGSSFHSTRPTHLRTLIPQIPTTRNPCPWPLPVETCQQHRIAQIPSPGPPASLASPLADFQSDDVLNAPYQAPTSPLEVPPSPMSGPIAHVGLPPALSLGSLERGGLQSERTPISPATLNVPTSQLEDRPAQVGRAQEKAEGGDQTVSPVRRKISTTTASNHKARNPFAPQGVEQWTRETWGKRKIALISGITGQGKPFSIAVYRQRC